MLCSCVDISFRVFFHICYLIVKVASGSVLNKSKCKFLQIQDFEGISIVYGPVQTRCLRPGPQAQTLV